MKFENKQFNRVHFSSATVEWPTPQGVFDELNEEFKFTLDPCATHENAKCEEALHQGGGRLESGLGTGERVHEPALWAVKSRTG